MMTRIFQTISYNETIISVFFFYVSTYIDAYVSTHIDAHVSIHSITYTAGRERHG